MAGIEIMTKIIPIKRTRGDTYPTSMTIRQSDGTPMDLTGKQVVLTANTEEDPVDTSTQVFQLVGTITDAENGQVEFPWDADAADNVGMFYYDVEVSDGQETPDPPAEYVIDLSGTEGEDVPLTGDVLWAATTDGEYSSGPGDYASYQVRDTVPVVRLPSKSEFFVDDIGNHLVACGDSAPVLGRCDQYLEVRGYIEDNAANVGSMGVGLMQGWPAYYAQALGYRATLYKQTTISDSLTLARYEGERANAIEWSEANSPQGIVLPGYFTIRLEVLFSTGLVRAKAWSDAGGDPGVWQVEHDDSGVAMFPGSLVPAVWCDSNMNGYVDVASFTWGEL
jgi:hypothetical protein